MYPKMYKLSPLSLGHLLVAPRRRTVVVGLALALVLAFVGVYPDRPAIAWPERTQSSEQQSVEFEAAAVDAVAPPFSKPTPPPPSSPCFVDDHARVVDRKTNISRTSLTDSQGDHPSEGEQKAMSSRMGLAESNGDDSPEAGHQAVSSRTRSMDDYLGLVTKTAVSSRMRLVFLVGLEGTGHHYLADVLDHTCQTASVLCPKVCQMAEALYPDLALPKSATDYELARKKLRHEMDTLAAYAREKIAEGKVAIASFGLCRFEAGMMSYPNFKGPDKPLQYVDFRLLAEEAERAGVDIRFVYLSRSAKSILISSIQHKHYAETFMKEARALLNNAAVVESTFRELGPGFATCFRYEDIADPDQADRVSRFIAPTEDVAQRLGQKMLAKISSRSPPAHVMVAAAQRPATNIHRKQQQQRFMKGGSRQRYTGGAGPRHTAHHEHLSRGLRGGSPEPWNSEGGSSAAKDLVAARLQQKLDRIEKDMCVTTTS